MRDLVPDSIDPPFNPSSDCKIYHDRPWQAGQNSFEDGYLTGLNKLIEVIEACKTVQERPAHSARAL